jgi:DMSO reductase anchor subunit
VSRFQIVRQFHEFSLMLFSTLAIAGAGTAAAPPLAFICGLVPRAPERAEAKIAVFLLASGLLVSLMHLGRPERMARALSRAGDNFLSTEVLAACIALAACVGATFLPERGLPTFILWGIAASAGTCFLVTLGFVYRLQGQIAWTGPATLVPLVLGFIYGLIALSAYNGRATSSLVTVIALLIGIDAGFWVVRWHHLERERNFGQPLHPGIFAARRRILAMRFLLVTFLPGFTYLSAMPVTALVILGIGLLHDRLAFYGLAIQRTPEAEIARIESILHQDFDSRQARSDQ